MPWSIGTEVFLGIEQSSDRNSPSAGGKEVLWVVNVSTVATTAPIPGGCRVERERELKRPFPKGES